MINEIEKVTCYFCKCPINLIMDLYKTDFIVLSKEDKTVFTHLDCFKKAKGFITNYNLIDQLPTKIIASAYLNS